MATHGDELIGVKIANKLKKTELKNMFDILIANPRALKKRVRFCDADLNRIFPGKVNGNYEERRACKIIKIGRRYRRVVDLHGSMSKTGIFIIITKLTKYNLLLALRFNIKRIVIWQNVRETSGSLSTFMPCGIEIESGFRDDLKVWIKLEKILKSFLINYSKNLYYEEEIKKKEIYKVIGKLEKNRKKPDRLRNWVKVDDYYPLFVGGQYKDIWCYKLKKISSDNCCKMI